MAKEDVLPYTQGIVRKIIKAVEDTCIENLENYPADFQVALKTAKDEIVKNVRNLEAELIK